MAAALAGIHLLSPWLRPHIEKREAALSSFGGGMAIAYVFLHLLGEIERGHELLGSRIHFVVLLGFLVYYCAEKTLGNASQRAGATRHLFSLQLVMAWLYSWLIIYAMPETLLNDGALAIPPTIALGLHVLHNDFHLGSEYGRRFDRFGATVLASAPLVAWVTDLYSFDDDPWVSNILVALLAGSLLYKVFSKELPNHLRSSMRWFLAGVLGFVLLNLIPLLEN